jgi:UPF0042 nucleotide-binding protein
MSFDIKHLHSLIIVAGLSGAGKSSVQNALEDSGYFVIDNLPVGLFSHFIDHTRSNIQKYKNTAALMRVDSSERQEAFLLSLKKMEDWSQKIELIFLDCSDEVIIKRYSETRRPHPGFDPEKDSRLEDVIKRERSRLEPIKQLANYRIDTSLLSSQDLKREVRSFLEKLPRPQKTKLRVNFLTFGFKYGIPFDCDLLVDVRFLKNPYFVEALRPKSGLEAEVQKFVLEQKAASEFIEHYTKLINFLLPHYQYEGKAYLNIAVGCTGGKHRSVSIAESLKNSCLNEGYSFSIAHRDINK